MDLPLNNLLEQELPPLQPSPSKTFEAILPAYIDSTMMSAFRSCPRKFYHEFLLGLRPAETSIHLHAGGCFASALEFFYSAVFDKNLPTVEAKKHAFVAFTQSWAEYPKEGLNPKGEETAKSFNRMWEAVDEYIATFPPLTDHVQPYKSDDGQITTEFSFAIPLDNPIFPRHPITGEPFIYAGRFDLLGSYLNRPCVMDQKTGSYAGATWAEQWDLRAQFMGYVWACQVCGIPLDTVIVRGVIIQKTQIKFPEAVKIFPQHMIDRWYHQLSRDLTRLVNCWNEGYFDYNFGDSCTAYGNCMFRSVCTSKVPSAWMNEYRISRWNPLLRVPVGDPKETVNSLTTPTARKEGLI